MVVRAPAGALVHGEYEAAHGWRGFRDRGLTVQRTVLDPILLDRARAAGARVREGAKVSDVVRDAGGRATGVRIAEGGEARVVEARLVVGADGLRSIVARRLGLARTSRWPRRLGLVAHFRGVQGVGELGEMHVERDGFVGIADVGDGLANTALVVPASRGREVAGDAAGFLDRWLAARPQLAARYAGAERVGAVRATGPFASHARRGWAPGAALVGDAADFFDPFTGEGIYAALRGAEILAHSLEAEGGVARAVRDARRLDLALRRYERARVRAFRGKWIVERLIGLAVAHPMLVNRASRVLEGRRDMADLLVGVVGDFVPPSQVLRARYLVDLFLRQPRAARP
jgi:flavin-dependent dehydrogenase